jgi:hypothetical protein
MKKIVLLILLCLGLLGAGWALEPTEAEGSGSGTVKDGYALLSDLTRVFEELVGKGSGLGVAEQRLGVVIADNAATYKDGKTDAIFHHRFRRLLLVFRLVLTPMTPENNVWEPVIRKELSDFVYDTLGEDWRFGAKDANAIGRMAAAMEEEFVSLWLYLDTLPQRQGLKKKFAGSMLPPPPPPMPKK